MAATLGASLLGNMLAGKGVLKAGKRTIGASQDFYSTALKDRSFSKKKNQKITLVLTW